MDILDHKYGLQALGFALIVAPDVADDQYNDAIHDPDIDEDSYLQVAAVLDEMDQRLGDYLLYERMAGIEPTLRGFLVWLLKEDEL